MTKKGSDKEWTYTTTGSIVALSDGPIAVVVGNAKNKDGITTDNAGTNSIILDNAGPTIGANYKIRDYVANTLVDGPITGQTPHVTNSLGRIHNETPSGVEVFQYSDVTDNGSGIPTTNAYSLSGTHSALFSVDDNGIVSTAKKIVWNDGVVASNESTLTFNIVVTDNKGNTTDSAVILSIHDTTDPVELLHVPTGQAVPVEVTVPSGQ